MKLSIRCLTIAVTLVTVTACTETSTPTDESHFLIAVAGYGGPLHIIDQSGHEVATISCGPGCGLYHPDWSRSGKLLSMIGYEQATLSSILFVSNADGSNLREITRTAPMRDGGPQGTIRLVGNKYQQGWSRSGQLAYIKRDTIFEMQTAQSKPLVVAAGVNTFDISWVGDTAIAYLSIDSPSKLQVVDIRSGQTKVIATFRGFVYKQDWAPDGSAYAVVVSKPDTMQLFKMYVADGSGTLMATNSEMSNPCFSEDSKSLTFIGHDYGKANSLFVVEGISSPPREVAPRLNPGGQPLWATTREILSEVSAGFAITDITTSVSTIMPGPPAASGFVISTSHCNKMFYLLPEGSG